MKGSELAFKLLIRNWISVSLILGKCALRAFRNQGLQNNIETFFIVLFKLLKAIHLFVCLFLLCLSSLIFDCLIREIWVPLLSPRARCGQQAGLNAYCFQGHFTSMSFPLLLLLIAREGPQNTTLHCPNHYLCEHTAFWPQSFLKWNVKRKNNSNIE